MRHRTSPWTLAATLLMLLASIPAMARGRDRGMGGGGMDGMPKVTFRPVAPADLPDPDSAGARLLVNRCTPCHGLASPGQHLAKDWPAVVERMNRRIGRMMPGQGKGMMHRAVQPLTGAETAILVAYLQRHAVPAPSQSRPSKADQAGAKTYAAVCSRCHVLPDPATYPADEWPAVVGRMVYRMKVSGDYPITGEQQKTILNYLKHHAGKE